MKTYTFHVSLPGFGRVWRKIEITAEQTLEDLHFAIQQAYDWDADHLYSFFMSGKAWDQETEYLLPEGVSPWGPMMDFEEEEDEFEDEDEEDEDLDLPEPEIDEATAARLRAALGDHESPKSVEELFALVESSPELRAELSKMMSEQFGIPAFMANMVLSNASSLLSMAPEEALFGLLGGPMGRDDAIDRDVRTTTIESLALEVGQTFMYLFDYGDEWRFNIRVHAIDEAANAETEYPRIVESVGEAPPQYPDWEDEDEDWEDEEEDEDWEDEEEDEDWEDEEEE